ncbi:MAG: DMT family transporter [Desulfobulbus sp.]|nr:DMT family transporter [Desulfobulbus sp.]
MPLSSSRTRQPDLPRQQQLLGWLAVFGSAVFFYLATAIISWGHSYVAVSATYYTFARFVLGFVLVGTVIIIKGHRPSCNHIHYIFGRTVTNALAVLCFYKAVDVSSLASANILNMTYPIFVAIFSWVTLKDQRDTGALCIVGLASLGIWLILDPTGQTLDWNNYWGLLSGFFAGVSIIYLNLSRQFHDAQTILFYMFGLGALCILPFLHGTIFMPGPLDLFFLLLCSIAGILGQYLLTYGFLYVTAVEGAVISSSRILIAAFLGPFLVADPPLTAAGWLGAVLLFAANVALAARKKTPQPHRPSSD